MMTYKHRFLFRTVLATAGTVLLCASVFPAPAGASAARLAGALPEPADDSPLMDVKDVVRGKVADINLGGTGKLGGGGGGGGKSLGGGGGGGKAVGGAGKTVNGVGGSARGATRDGGGKPGGRGHLGGHNWGNAPTGGEYFGGRSYDGGIGGRAFEEGNPRGSAGTSSQSSGDGTSGGGASVTFGGPAWTPGSAAVANARPGASRAIILTSVAGSAAEAAAAAASAATAITAWPWSNPEVAEPTFAAAQAALTAGKHAQAALLATAPQAMKLEMDNAQKSSEEARAAAQKAVQAWQRSPGLFSSRSRAAAEAAVRAAEAAAIEIQVASRALSIAHNRTLAQTGESGRVIAASAVVPSAKPQPAVAKAAAPASQGRAGVVSAALTVEQAPDYTRVMERAETSAVAAAKSNADAQVAAISAFATMDPSEANRFVDAARAAANDAKSAAEAAAHAHAQARALAQKDVDSVAAQAQAEVAARAAEKARLHAQSAESAAERARGVMAVKEPAPQSPIPRLTTPLAPTRTSASASGK